MSWVSPPVFTVGEVAKSSDLNVLASDISLLASAISAIVSTSQTTASTGYADLATVGPAVTVVTGVHALVILTANIANSAQTFNNMGYAVSAGTTIAAADATALSVDSAMTATGQQVSATYLQGSLTAGSNTFTAKYRVGAGTGTFTNRNIIVCPLP